MLFFKKCHLQVNHSNIGVLNVACMRNNSCVGMLVPSKYPPIIIFTVCRGSETCITYTDKQRIHPYQIKCTLIILTHTDYSYQPASQALSCDGQSFHTIMDPQFSSSDTVIRSFNPACYVRKPTEAHSSVHSLLLWLITLIWA